MVVYTLIVMLKLYVTTGMWTSSSAFIYLFGVPCSTGNNVKALALHIYVSSFDTNSS